MTSHDPDQERTSIAMAAWEGQYQAMRSSQRELEESGRWRGGERTLLAAIGRQDGELALTAGLAWLLRPDGHHGLGSAMLKGLLAWVGITGAVEDVRVVTEESRGADHADGLDRTTRADLLVYGSNWTIVIEAKTSAPEQDRQLERLYHHWQREAAPCFVFLSRGDWEPVSAAGTRASWHLLTWGDIAQLARASADGQSDAAGGVREFTETLEAYQMPEARRQHESADVKAQFYLEHRRHIEKWAGLRQEAGDLLSQHLIIALAPEFQRLAAEFNAEFCREADDVEYRWLSLRRASWEQAGLPRVDIGLRWVPDKLLRPGDQDEWPSLCVYASLDKVDERRQAMTKALAGVRSALGGRPSGDYLFWRHMQPAEGAKSADLDELARSALRESRSLWAAAAPILDAMQLPAKPPDASVESDPDIAPPA